MVTNSRKVFIDSSFFLAFIDRSDLNHAQAAEIFELVANQRYEVYTSSIVVIQTYNAIERDFSLAVAYEFLHAMLESSIHVMYIDKSDLDLGFKYIKRNPNQKGSFPSILKASLMQKHHINSLLTFDFWPKYMGIIVSPLITA